MTSISATIPTTTAKTVKPELIDRAIEALQNLPPKPKPVPMGETIAKLQAMIRQAFSDGYTPEEVCGLLFNQGIEISPKGLRYHLSRARTAPNRVPKAGKTASPKAPSKEPLPVETVNEPVSEPEEQSIPLVEQPIVSPSLAEVPEIIQPEIMPSPPQETRPSKTKTLPSVRSEKAQGAVAKTTAATRKATMTQPKSSGSQAAKPSAKAPAKPVVAFSLKAIPFQPPYDKSTSITEALKAVFRKHKGKQLTIDDLIKILYGDVEEPIKAKVRSRLSTDLSKGRQKGLWKPGQQPGTHTLAS